MRLAGFLIVLHVTPHLTTEDSPLKLSHGTSYQTMPHSSQPQSIRRIAIQAGTGFGFISDIIYLAFLCTLREYLLKATELCQRQPPLLSGPPHLTRWKSRSPKDKLEWLCQPDNKTLVFQLFRGPEHRTTTAFTTWQPKLSKVFTQGCDIPFLPRAHHS